MKFQMWYRHRGYYHNNLDHPIQNYRCFRWRQPQQVLTLFLPAFPFELWSQHPRTALILLRLRHFAPTEERSITLCKNFWNILFIMVSIILIFWVTSIMINDIIKCFALYLFSSFCVPKGNFLLILYIVKNSGW